MMTFAAEGLKSNRTMEVMFNENYDEHNEELSTGY